MKTSRLLKNPRTQSAQKATDARREGTPCTLQCTSSGATTQTGLFQQTARRIGVFGGTFDPVHAGHVGILQAAQRHFGFDWIYVVPAAQNPLKTRAASPLRVRLAGLRRVMRPLEFVRLSLIETSERTSGYTIDTLGYFARRHPAAKLFFVCGSDCLRTFYRWKNPKGILKLATVAVVHRPGHPIPRTRKGFEVFPMKPMPVSSTQIRSGLSR